jgi:uncharacterized phage-like protein YoqJ
LGKRFLLNFITSLFLIVKNMGTHVLNQIEMENIIQTEKKESTQPTLSPLKSCVFTGHRILEKNFSPKAMTDAIDKAIEDGVTVFYNGMAMGFDLLAAEYLITLKKINPKLKLIACIPCYGQEKNFPDEDKARYVAVLKRADEQVLLSQTYFRGCMQNRDRYMADRADMMIAYCHKKKGGAAYTVNYFSKKNKPIFFV